MKIFNEFFVPWINGKMESKRKRVQNQLMKQHYLQDNSQPMIKKKYHLILDKS